MQYYFPCDLLCDIWHTYISLIKNALEKKKSGAKASSHFSCLIWIVLDFSEQSYVHLMRFQPEHKLRFSPQVSHLEVRSVLLVCTCEKWLAWGLWFRGTKNSLDLSVCLAQNVHLAKRQRRNPRNKYPLLHDPDLFQEQMICEGTNTSQYLKQQQGIKKKKALLSWDVHSRYESELRGVNSELIS